MADFVGILSVALAVFAIAIQLASVLLLRSARGKAGHAAGQAPDGVIVAHRNSRLGGAMDATESRLGKFAVAITKYLGNSPRAN